MERKIMCYGVRDYEVSTFDSLAKQYNYELVYSPKYLNNDIRSDAYGYEIVMVRGNCPLNKESLADLKEHGLKTLLTRTAGYNHIDVKACKDLGINCAFAPGYSPNAISELTLTLAMSLLRNVAYATNRTRKGNFLVTNQMFSREVRSCTVGILGCGKIGRTTGSLFKGLGARVVGYDPYPTDAGREILEYMPLDKFIGECDIICCHLPYIKGVNEDFINAEFISKMKEHSILVNTARGEVMDYEAVIEAVESKKLDGLALDVVKNEKALFFKDRTGEELSDPVHSKLLELYPRVIITPHIGSASNLALRDMIEFSLKNMDEILASGTCKNSLTK